MPRSYKHISYYENEILELRKQGLSKREIREKLGFTIKQLIYFYYNNYFIYIKNLFRFLLWYKYFKYTCFSNKKYTINNS